MALWLGLRLNGNPVKMKEQDSSKLKTSYLRCSNMTNDVYNCIFRSNYDLWRLYGSLLFNKDVIIKYKLWLSFNDKCWRQCLLPEKYNFTIFFGPQSFFNMCHNHRKHPNYHVVYNRVWKLLPPLGCHNAVYFLKREQIIWWFSTCTLCVLQKVSI